MDPRSTITVVITNVETNAEAYYFMRVEVTTPEHLKLLLLHEPRRTEVVASARPCFKQNKFTFIVPEQRISRTETPQSFNIQLSLLCIQQQPAKRVTLVGTGVAKTTGMLEPQQRVRT
jgi:hypothetical protein